MKRGSIILVREPGSPAAKPRPCVVVQNEISLSDTTKVTAIPLTSHLSGATRRRPMLVPNETNGLKEISEAQVDWIFSFDPSHVGRMIGETDIDVMPRIDDALRIWLDL